MLRLKNNNMCSSCVLVFSLPCPSTDLAVFAAVVCIGTELEAHLWEYHTARADTDTLLYRNNITATYCITIYSLPPAVWSRSTASSRRVAAVQLPSRPLTRPSVRQSVLLRGSDGRRIPAASCSRTAEYPACRCHRRHIAAAAGSVWCACVILFSAVYLCTP